MGLRSDFISELWKHVSAAMIAAYIIKIDEVLTIAHVELCATTANSLSTSPGYLRSFGAEQEQLLLGRNTLTLKLWLDTCVSWVHTISSALFAHSLSTSSQLSIGKKFWRASAGEGWKMETAQILSNL